MPNISNARLHELERAQKRLADLEVQQSIYWVGEALGRAFAVIYAATPYANWPIERRQILKQVCNGAETALQLYIETLPKE